VIHYNDAIYLGEVGERGAKYEKLSDCLTETKKIRHGRGYMRYRNGRLYEGHWKDNKRDGKGYEQFANGNSYEGMYKEGKPDGQGTYKWVKREEQFSGLWYQGMKYGYGIWQRSNGDMYCGQWANSLMHGYGIFEHKEGNRYEGEFVDGLKEGQGSEIFADGESYYVGEFKSGRFHG